MIWQCVRYDNTDNNSKYTLQQMLRYAEWTKTPYEQKFIQAKTHRELWYG